MQSGIAIRFGALFHQRRKIKWRLGRPAHERKLLMRKKSVPSTFSAPVVDETRGRATVVAHGYTRSGLPGDALDFRKRLSSGSANFPEKVECRWLIKRDAGNCMRPAEGHMQSDTAAVGMTDEVHRPAIAVDQVNRPFRFVCEREDM